jgi:hypothetical protein
VVQQSPCVSQAASRVAQPRRWRRSNIRQLFSGNRNPLGSSAAVLALGFCCRLPSADACRSSFETPHRHLPAMSGRHFVSMPNNISLFMPVRRRFQRRKPGHPQGFWLAELLGADELVSIRAEIRTRADAAAFCEPRRSTKSLRDPGHHLAANRCHCWRSHRKRRTASHPQRRSSCRPWGPS